MTGQSAETAQQRFDNAVREHQHAADDFYRLNRPDAERARAVPTEANTGCDTDSSSEAMDRLQSAAQQMLAAAQALGAATARPATT